MPEQTLTLTTLLKYFEKCQRNHQPIIFMVSIPDTPKPEMITNPPENIPAKIKYLKNAYNEDLTHKFSAGVSIVGFMEMNIEEKELLN